MSSPTAWPIGRRFRAVTVVDNLSRERPAIEVERSLSGQRMAAVRARGASAHGLPETRFADHGPECTSKALDAWAPRHGVQLAFSRPETPTDHPCVEAVNARFREACLHQHGVMSIAEARTAIAAWRVEDTTERPHAALRHPAPAEYNAHWLQTRERQTARDDPDRWTKVWVRTNSPQTYKSEH
jgi:putative transposase